MFRVSFLIILFLVLTANIAFSEVFIVTSKEDSGPGTLRQALLDAAANGKTTNDEIRFNLPVNGDDINDRTIRLRSQLPVVTSKVMIDGSTQPSPVLGVSGARVIIEREFPNQFYSGLIISNSSIYNEETTDVEIYGLYIRGFANITSLSNVNTSQGSGIVIEYAVNNITIGKPGKGNVICGSVNGIVIRNTSGYYVQTQSIRTIKIQSNFIGVMDNGSSVNTNFTGINAADLYEHSLTIGGDNAGEGNVIAGNGTDISVNRTYYNSSFKSIITINGNKIGTDQTGTMDYKGLPIFSQSSAVEMYGIKVNAQYADLNIFKNVVSGHQSAGIAIANADFMIGGNYIGTSSNGTGQLANTVGIRIETGAQGKIGGSAAADPNYIGYNTFGIDVMSNRTVTITRNSIYCNERFGIGEATGASQAFIQVLKQRNNYISGKTNPNAEVELFYSDNCAGSCQGKTYISTVRADNSGRWQYNGALTGHVVGTASLNSYVTSMFSTAALLQGEEEVEPVTCKGGGSITIREPREGVTFEWYKLETNGAAVRIPVSATTQQITNLEVGTFELRISDGCKTIPKTFSITDQILIKPVITPPSPGCGQTQFSFSVNSYRGKGFISYTWYNASNQMVASGSQVVLPQGTYKVKAADEAGCELYSDPVTIARKPAPVINLSAMRSSPAKCGIADGSIKGITISDQTGNLSYKWYAYDLQNYPTYLGQAIGVNTIDLENVMGGTYILEVTDQGQCSPVYSSPLTIGIIQSVFINGGAITPTTCHNPNGKIMNITLTQANSYIMYDPAGAILKQGSYSPGNVLDFEDLPSGTYRLVATNANCSNTQTYVVYETPLPNFNITSSPPPVKTTCGLNNGSIRIVFQGGSPSRWEWSDQSNQILTGTMTELKDLAPGTYKYTAYDGNNCPQEFTFTVGAVDILTINKSAYQPIDDYCQLGRGSITGIIAQGGLGTHKYKWVDADDKVVGNTSDLKNVPEGQYKLIVTDQSGCGYAETEVFTLRNNTVSLNDPVIDQNGLNVCYTSDILVRVTNVEEGSYKLFQSSDHMSLMEENTKGIFVIKAAKSADYFIQRKLGECETDLIPFHIEVTNDNLEIANTMTPNGDGKNDIWTLKGLPDHPKITIQLYSRDGQLVYESIGPYNRPFDGYFRGAPLPAGVYYYRIDLKADCKPLSGSLTLLR